KFTAEGHGTLPLPHHNRLRDGEMSVDSLAKVRSYLRIAAAKCGGTAKISDPRINPPEHGTLHAANQGIRWTVGGRGVKERGVHTKPQLGKPGIDAIHTRT